MWRMKRGWGIPGPHRDAKALRGVRTCPPRPGGVSHHFAIDGEAVSRAGSQRGHALRPGCESFTNCRAKSHLVAKAIGGRARNWQHGSL